MARTAKSPVYVSGQVRDKVADRASKLTTIFGRNITYGEAVERALDDSEQAVNSALRERQEASRR